MDHQDIPQSTAQANTQGDTNQQPIVSQVEEQSTISTSQENNSNIVKNLETKQDDNQDLQAHSGADLHLEISNLSGDQVQQQGEGLDHLKMQDGIDNSPCLIGEQMESKDLHGMKTDPLIDPNNPVSTEAVVQASETQPDQAVHQISSSSQILQDDQFTQLAEQQTNNSHDKSPKQSTQSPQIQSLSPQQQFNGEEEEHEQDLQKQSSGEQHKSSQLLHQPQSQPHQENSIEVEQAKQQQQQISSQIPNERQIQKKEVEEEKVQQLGNAGAKKKVNGEMKNFLNLLKKVEEAKQKKESKGPPIQVSQIKTQEPLGEDNQQLKQQIPPISFSESMSPSQQHPDSNRSQQESRGLASIIEESNAFDDPPILQTTPSQSNDLLDEKIVTNELFLVSQAGGTRSLINLQSRPPVPDDEFNERFHTVSDTYEQKITQSVQENRIPQESSQLSRNVSASANASEIIMNANDYIPQQEAENQNLLEETINLIKQSMKEEHPQKNQILNNLSRCLDSQRFLVEQNEIISERNNQLQHKNNLLEKTVEVSKVQIKNLQSQHVKVTGEYEYIQGELGKMRLLESQLTNSLEEAKAMNNNFSEMLRAKTEESRMKEVQSRQIRDVIEHLATQMSSFQEGFYEINAGLKNLFLQVMDSNFWEKDSGSANIIQSLISYREQAKPKNSATAIGRSAGNDFEYRSPIGSGQSQLGESQNSRRSNSAKKLQRRASVTPSTQSIKAVQTISQVLPSASKPHSFSNMHNFASQGKLISTPKSRSQRVDLAGNIIPKKLKE